MIDISDVAVIERVGHGDEGYGGEGPPEGSGRDEDIRLLVDVLVLAIG